jgi:hypothetical protein
MLIRDQDILLTLNLLVLRYQTQQIYKNHWSAEKLNTLHITKEHVADAGLTIPVFLNTLEDIARKGYISNTPIPDQKARERIADVQAGKYNTLIEQELLKVDTPETQKKLKAGIATLMQKITPQGTSLIPRVSSHQICVLKT